MAEEEPKAEDYKEIIGIIMKKLDDLDKIMNARFDKLKEAVIGYMNLGSDMVKGSVITSLKNI